LPKIRKAAFLNQRNESEVALQTFTQINNNINGIKPYIEIFLIKHDLYMVSFICFSTQAMIKLSK